MGRLDSVLPLPGISELEDVARGLMRRLKDLNYEDEKQKALADRLAALIEMARQLDDILELTSQLCDIQARFDLAAGSTSRLGKMMYAQRKLALWEELDAKINRIIETTTLRALGNMQKTLAERRAITSIESKLPVIPSYEIADQVEISSWRSSSVYSQGITVRNHTGRLGKLPVTYKTFVSHADASAALLIEQELDYISQMLHPNIAALAGVTQGYHGLNGYIVVTGGLPVDDFFQQTHTGAAISRYLKDMTSAYDSYGQLWAEAITVEPNGHLTVYPLAGGTLYIEPGVYYNNHADPAIAMLIRAYGHSYKHQTLQIQEQILKHCRTLSRGFTELQVAHVLALSLVTPPPANYYFERQDDGRPPSSTTRPGDICTVAPGMNVFESHFREWISLGASRHLEHFRLSAYVKANQPSRTQWISYDLTTKLCSSSGRVRQEVRLELEGQIDWDCWEEILAEARDISERQNIDFDGISLCWAMTFRVELAIGSSDNKTERPKSLYFHHNPYSDQSDDFWGFFSASADPECKASRQTLEERGWKMDYVAASYKVYNMSDDWGRRHERLVEEGLAAMPGGFACARIEELP